MLVGLPVSHAGCSFVDSLVNLLKHRIWNFRLLYVVSCFRVTRTYGQDLSFFFKPIQIAAAQMVKHFITLDRLLLPSNTHPPLRFLSHNYLMLVLQSNVKRERNSEADDGRRHRHFSLVENNRLPFRSRFMLDCKTNINDLIQSQSDIIFQNLGAVPKIT